MTPMPLKEFTDRLNEILPSLSKEFSHRHQNDIYRGKITIPQFVILEFLGKEGPERMTDLALYMKVTTAAMTGIISRLVSAGYVRRETDPKDRRIIRARLTAKGEGLVKKVDEDRRRVITDVFGQISETEREDYLRILMRIKDVLTQGREIG